MLEDAGRLPLPIGCTGNYPIAFASHRYEIFAGDAHEWQLRHICCRPSTAVTMASTSIRTARVIPQIASAPQPILCGPCPDVPTPTDLLKAHMKATRLTKEWALKSKAYLEAGKRSKAREALRKAEYWDLERRKLES